MDSRLARIATPSYAAVAAIVVLLHVPPVLATVLAGPLVLLVPGIALLAALDLPGQAEYPGRRLVLSIALSLATTALGGLILNAVADLRATPWVIWLVVFTFVCSAVGWLRASSDEGLAAEAAAARHSATQRVRSAPWRQLAVAGIAVLLFAGAAVLTEESSRSHYDKPLTQFSLAPAAGSHGHSVRLTIANLTPNTEEMNLTLFRGSSQIATVPVKVLPSHSWTREETLAGGVLRATLTTLGGLEPFSEVSWTGSGTAVTRAPRIAVTRHRRPSGPAKKAS
ncbi:MAG TPA: DUF1616 domain-containing protein [Solirubrobacteraceae bacterium]|nr:DUF1616 domain-containing protein [Solirubrobacteraceae bacterium]